MGQTNDGTVKLLNVFMAALAMAIAVPAAGETIYLSESADSIVEDNRKTMCTVTINSEEERKTFEEHLPKTEWKIVELIPKGTHTGTEMNESKDTSSMPDWLQTACDAEIQCDAISVSGHFAGYFFGASGKSLSVEQMERSACTSTCDGIFKKPKEAFLFGCNTVAGKEPDARNDQQYVDAVMAHRDEGMDRQAAEIAAAFRYSPWGQANKERMAEVFPNAKIYGYDSVGPSGKTVTPRLSRYLKATARNYSEYIDQLDKKDPPNMTLAKTMHDTSFREVIGVGANRPDSSAICYLSDEERSLENKLRFVSKQLRGPNPLLHAPAIASWLEKTFDRKMSDREAEQIEALTAHKALKERFLKFADSIGNLPVSQLAIWRFAKLINWFSKAEYETRITDLVNRIFTDGKVSVSERDIVTSLTLNERLAYRRSAKLPISVKSLDANSASALGHLRYRSPEFIARTRAMFYKSSGENVKQFAGALLGSLTRDLDGPYLYSRAKKEKDLELQNIWFIMAARAQNPPLPIETWRETLGKLENSKTIEEATPHLVLFYFNEPPAEIVKSLLESAEPDLSFENTKSLTLYVYVYMSCAYNFAIDLNKIADGLLQDGYFHVLDRVVEQQCFSQEKIAETEHENLYQKKKFLDVMIRKVEAQGDTFGSERLREYLKRLTDYWDIPKTGYQ